MEWNEWKREREERQREECASGTNDRIELFIATNKNNNQNNWATTKIMCVEIVIKFSS